MQGAEESQEDLENNKAARLAVKVGIRRRRPGTGTDEQIGRTERQHAEDVRAWCLLKNYN